MIEMKAERKQPEFEPVIITLESEDELNYLWHCLNIYKSNVKELASKNLPFPRKIDDGTMWKQLDKIVRPERY